MSSITKPLQQAIDLEFLNGEIAKAKETIKTLKDEISFLELDKQTKTEAYKQSDFNLKKQLARTENSVSEKEEELALLVAKVDSQKKELFITEASIEKNKVAIETSLADIAVREEKIKQQEANGLKQMAILTSAMKDVEKSQKETAIDRQFLVEREQEINKKEEQNIAKALELDRRENGIRSVEVTNENTMRMNAVRSAEIDKQAMELSTERQKFALLNEGLLSAHHRPIES